MASPGKQGRYGSLELTRKEFVVGSVLYAGPGHEKSEQRIDECCTDLEFTTRSSSERPSCHPVMDAGGPHATIQVT
jgi:hypothetical protein